MIVLTPEEVEYLVEAIDRALEEGYKTLKLHEEDDTVFDEFSAAKNAETLLELVGMQHERIAALQRARKILTGSEDNGNASSVR